MLGAARHALYNDGIAAPRHKAKVFSADPAHLYAHIADIIPVHARPAEVLGIRLMPAKVINLILDVAYYDSLFRQVFLHKLAE